MSRISLGLKGTVVAMALRRDVPLASGAEAGRPGARGATNVTAGTTSSRTPKSSTAKAAPPRQRTSTEDVPLSPALWGTNAAATDRLNRTTMHRRTRTRAPTAVPTADASVKRRRPRMLMRGLMMRPFPSTSQAADASTGAMETSAGGSEHGEGRQRTRARPLCGRGAASDTSSGPSTVLDQLSGGAGHAVATSSTADLAVTVPQFSPTLLLLVPARSPSRTRPQVQEHPMGAVRRML